MGGKNAGSIDNEFKYINLFFFGGGAMIVSFCAFDCRCWNYVLYNLNMLFNVIIWL